MRVVFLLTLSLLQLCGSREGTKQENPWLFSKTVSQCVLRGSSSCSSIAALVGPLLWRLQKKTYEKLQLSLAKLEPVDVECLLLPDNHPGVRNYCRAEGSKRRERRAKRRFLPCQPFAFSQNPKVSLFLRNPPPPDLHVFLGLFSGFFGAFFGLFGF